MAALVNSHGQNLIARLKQSEINGLIGVRARMGLNIGIIGLKQFFSPADGRFFNLVNKTLARIISFFRIPFGVTSA